jgi:hypothetical protein
LTEKGPEILQEQILPMKKDYESRHRTHRHPKVASGIQDKMEVWS